MSSPGFLPQRPICRFAPPPTCAAGGTWLGCGWRVEGDGSPRDGLGLRDPVAYSLLGGGVPYPEHRLHWSLDSVPSIRFLFFPSVMVWSLPFFFSPPRFIRVPCYTNILPVSSLFSSYLPPLRRFCLFSRPPPVSIPHIVRPPSSVRQKTTNPPDSTDQCLLLVYYPSVPYVGLHPPPTCEAVGTWLGCGWRAEGDGSPRDGLESLDSLAGVARVSVPSSTLEFPLDSCGACLSVCPPPLPLSLYNRTCTSTLPPNGRLFL